MRSKTTRRSAPITRSRFRSPTSKSTTTTFCPPCASAAPRAAVEVVFPTPPLPDVTTKTVHMLRPSPNRSRFARSVYRNEQLFCAARMKAAKGGCFAVPTWPGDSYWLMKNEHRGQLKQGRKRQLDVVTDRTVRIVSVILKVGEIAREE